MREKAAPPDGGCGARWLQFAPRSLRGLRASLMGFVFISCPGRAVQGGAEARPERGEAAEAGLQGRVPAAGAEPQGAAAGAVLQVTPGHGRGHRGGRVTEAPLRVPWASGSVCGTPHLSSRWDWDGCVSLRSPLAQRGTRPCHTLHGEEPGSSGHTRNGEPALRRSAMLREGLSIHPRRCGPRRQPIGEITRPAAAEPTAEAYKLSLPLPGQAPSCPHRG